MVVESISIPPICRNSSKTPTPTLQKIIQSFKNFNLMMLKPNLHLEALSEFYTSNFVTERRNLKGNIEQKTIETNRNFLEIFGKITE
ncbi:19039_t:CDS:1, partial [Gigaspora margarita]